MVLRKTFAKQLGHRRFRRRGRRVRRGMPQFARKDELFLVAEVLNFRKPFDDHVGNLPRGRNDGNRSTGAGNGELVTLTALAPNSPTPNNGVNITEFAVTVVPEPSTLVLALAETISVIGLRR